MKAPSDEMAMRPLTEGTKRRTGLEKRLAWELERWAQALVLSDPVPTLRKTRHLSSTQWVCRVRQHGGRVRDSRRW